MGWVVSKQNNISTNNSEISDTSLSETSNNCINKTLNKTANNGTVPEICATVPPILSTANTDALPLFDANICQSLCHSVDSNSGKSESAHSLKAEVTQQIVAKKHCFTKDLSANKLNIVEIKESHKVKTKLSSRPVVKSHPLTSNSHESQLKRRQTLNKAHRVAEKTFNNSTPITATNIRHKPFIPMNRKNYVKNLPPLEKENIKLSSKHQTDPIKSIFKPIKHRIIAPIKDMEKPVKPEKPSDLLVVEEGHLSPVVLNDSEKNIASSHFDSNENDKSAVQNKGNKKLKSIRPNSTSNIDDFLKRKESYDFIINDFSRKMSSLIKENQNHCMFCNNCSKTEESSSSQNRTAGKITFFFIKRYGNFGKFLLARLNEFLDSVHNDQLTSNENSLSLQHNIYPLPCNENDIEVNCELKPKPTPSDDDNNLLLVKTKKSKLPKLIIQTKSTKHNNRVVPKVISVTEKAKNISTCIDDELLKSGVDCCVDFKSIPNSTKDCSCGLDFPPLKSAESIDNFVQKSTSTKFDTNDLPTVYKTIDLSNPDSKMSSRSSKDLSNSLSDNATGTNKGGDDDITELANKLIDDLWLSNDVKVLMSKSLND